MVIEVNRSYRKENKEWMIVLEMKDERKVEGREKMSKSDMGEKEGEKKCEGC